MTDTKWPTPTEQDGSNDGGASQFSRHSVPLNAAVKTPFPTIGCNNMGGASGSFKKLHAAADSGLITEKERAAMASGGQLSPEWVEFLMGWPVGWTDADGEPRAWLPLDEDPADLPADDPNRIPRLCKGVRLRAKRIKALGNGQVPLCAANALAQGLAFFAALDAAESTPNPETQQ